MLPEIAYPERKVPVIVRPTYTVSLERTSGLTFAHCDVHVPWSPSVKKALLEDWRAFRRLHDDQILAMCRTDNRKLRKFYIMFGFTPAGTFEDAATGADTQLFIHTGA